TPRTSPVEGSTAALDTATVSSSVLAARLRTLRPTGRGVSATLAGETAASEYHPSLTRVSLLIRRKSGLARRSSADRTRSPAISGREALTASISAAAGPPGPPLRKA